MSSVGAGQDRFPGYDVIDRAGQWDPVTREVVIRRLGTPAPLRFFTAGEERVARPLLDRLLALDDVRIPVLEAIDGRLAAGETDGWRYAELPEDGEAWRQSLHHLDEDAHIRSRRPFGELSASVQRVVLEDVRTAGQWHGLPARRVWSLWMRYACTAFYAHPEAWNEIGFGGPAYPVGYANLGLDKREHWEVQERDAFDPEPWAQRVQRARQEHRS